MLVSLHHFLPLFVFQCFFSPVVRLLLVHVYVNSKCSSVCTMARVIQALDGERIKDFSSILYDLLKRQDSLEMSLNQVIKSLEEMTTKHRLLSEEVVRLQRVVALNNVVIALKRDANGEFEPVSIQKIVKEIIQQTSLIPNKRSCPSDQ